MKSFNSVYKSEDKKRLNEQQVEYDKQRAKLVNAIKKEFGINDFSQISEAERKSYKSMINEMWSKEKGLNTKGYMFLIEACLPLTKKSTEEQIEKCFKKKVKANAAKCVMALIKGEHCEIISDCKTEIENKTGKKISDNKYKKWVFDVCGKFLGESVKNTNLNPLNEDIENPVYICCTNNGKLWFDFCTGVNQRFSYSITLPVSGDHSAPKVMKCAHGKCNPASMSSLKIFGRQAADLISRYPLLCGFNSYVMDDFLCKEDDCINNIKFEEIDERTAVENISKIEYGDDWKKNDPSVVNDTIKQSTQSYEKFKELYYELRKSYTK